MNNHSPSQLECAQWGIDYRTKELAEMAGQFPDSVFSDPKIDAYNALEVAYAVHERTAMAYEAKIIELQAKCDEITKDLNWWKDFYDRAATEGNACLYWLRAKCKKQEGMIANVKLYLGPVKWAELFGENEVNN